MKKRSVFGVLIISILLISVISVSLVSAGLFEDAWNKITGRVVDNETEATNETEAEECPTIIGWKIENNRCVSDSGCDYDPLIYNYDNTEERCMSKLREEGAEEVEETEPRPEPGPEIPPEKCAAEIKISFDKSVYYIGDKVRVEVDILDSQGNHLPNYPFNSQIYSFDDGLWHTGEPGRTDGNGNFIQDEGSIESEQPIGKLKLKAYTLDTSEYSNCNSVEDIVEIEIREKKEKSEPVPCGIGTCIPEEEAEEPKEIPEDKIFYKCNGCELEDKCYPMGYRKEGQYCSDDYEFVSQMSGECDNDFECKSNVCISGECVEEGLMRRIIKWFKKMFGGGNEEPEEPSNEICRELLIEENINDYEYFITEYGKREEQQVAVYSEDGEQIDIAKCCMAGYLEDGEAKGTAGVVCPFNNRGDVENSIYWLSDKEEIVLGEYKGQEVYVIGNSIIWIHKDFIVAAGTDPNTPVPRPEDIVDAYLEKYPNDL